MAVQAVLKKHTEVKPRSDKVVKNAQRSYAHYYYNGQHAAENKTCLSKLLDVIDKKTKGCGYFVLMSNDFKDPGEEFDFRRLLAILNSV